MILPIALLLFLGSTDANGSPDIVARIKGKAVTRAEAKTGAELLGKVLRVLLDDFARAQNIVVTKAELNAHAQTMKKAATRREKEWQVRIQQLEGELRRAGVPADVRLKNEEELASLRRMLALDEEAEKTLQGLSPEMLSMFDQNRSRILLGWKTNQALYKKYGGRVIFQQFGPEPIDAYVKLLREQQGKRGFEIVDKSLENSFWDYLINDKVHGLIDGPDAKQLMSTPWWLNDAPPDEGEAAQDLPPH